MLLQDSGSRILSMDALFGLPRKKSAGHSFRDALHGHLLFTDQRSVDEYVAGYVMGKKPSKVCTLSLRTKFPAPRF